MRIRCIFKTNLQVSYPGPNIPQGLYSQDDLPKTLVQTLNQGSPVTSMDFHPLQQTILLGMALLCDSVYFSCLLENFYAANMYSLLLWSSWYTCG